MPEMELGAEPLPENDSDVGLQLLSYMLYPDDQDLRNQVLAAVGAIAIDAFSKRENEFLENAKDLPLPESFDVKAYWDGALGEVTENVFRAHGGGYRPLAMGGGLPVVGADAENAHLGWLTCGIVLTTVATLHHHHRDDLRGGASIGKAVDLLESFTSRNRDQLRRAWTRWKKVAPLCAAYLTLDTMIPREAWKDEDGHIVGPVLYCADMLLEIAVWYEEFGATFTPDHGRREPILSPTEIWTVPAALNINAGRVKLAPLSSEQIAWLKERKAPARY